ncbi:MAG TPA: flagellar basal body-associated FliL family protein [Polyangiaceae bacterium]|jgi:flagellar basal body-associated protein FliL
MEEQGSEAGAPVEKKKSKGPLVGIAVAAVLVLGAGAAGAVMGPKFFSKPAATEKKVEEPAASDDDASGDKTADSDKTSDDDKPADGDEDKSKKPAAAGEVKEVTNLQPIVIDMTAADGQLRHLRIALSIEHPDAMKEAEFKPYVPRAREAAIWYLRTHAFEEVSAPKNFEKLRSDLNTNIIAAVGKKRARRVLITDFVAQ